MDTTTSLLATSTTKQFPNTTSTQISLTTKSELPFSTLHTITNAINNTTLIQNNQSLFFNFCPGFGKTIDCSAYGGFVYIADAFYGVSDQVPAVCEYK